MPTIAVLDTLAVDGQPPPDYIPVAVPTRAHSNISLFPQGVAYIPSRDSGAISAPPSGPEHTEEELYARLPEWDRRRDGLGEISEFCEEVMAALWNRAVSPSHLGPVIMALRDVAQGRPHAPYTGPALFPGYDAADIVDYFGLRRFVNDFTEAA